MSVKKITVTALETALKDIMRQTPFEKITVSDITNRCASSIVKPFIIILQTSTPCWVRFINRRFLIPLPTV